jgi:cell wall-associated NlpC family hydrolase
MGRIRDLDEPRHGQGAALALRVFGVLVLALSLVIPWGPTAKADPPADPPTAEDAQVARDAVAAGTLDVRQAEAALDALRVELEEARIRVQVAAADYAEAQQAVERAEQEVTAARRAAQKARTGEAAARAGLAQVYRSSARDAGLGSLGIAFEADSVPDLVGRSAAARAVQRKLGGAMAEYQEARASADSADARWTAARKQRTVAAEQAERAFDAAQDAAADLETRTQDAEVDRAALVERLAQLRQTSVEIERQREAARAAAAEAAREAAAKAELEQQPRARAEAEAQPDAGADESGAEAPGEEAPGEETPGAEAGSGAAPESSGSAQPPAPEPVPVGPSTSGGTDGRGAGAVTWARSKIGAPYLLGAAGPTYYDCSGLTMMSWASQGVDITRTSRSQYLAVGKVGYGSLRTGDLIFYGSSPSDPSSIYHVAMYTGGGMMIEATLPGQPLSENPVRYSDAMPYAGRP